MSAALAISVDAALQGASHQSFEQFGRVSGQLVPSVRPQHGKRSATVSYPTEPRTLRERLAAALRRRVGIGKSITPKQLAYALQLSGGTIDNLMNGNNDPSGRALMALLTFFDAGFANEILEPTGCTVAKLSDARAEALRKISEGMAELRSLG